LIVDLNLARYETMSDYIEYGFTLQLGLEDTWKCFQEHRNLARSFLQSPCG